MRLRMAAVAGVLVAGCVGGPVNPVDVKCRSDLNCGGDFVCVKPAGSETGSCQARPGSAGGGAAGGAAAGGAAGGTMAGGSAAGGSAGGSAPDAGVDAGVPLFAISGSVSGLLGRGLVLRNNGADDLSVSDAGTFSFATRLPSGAAYDVTVGTQPATPTQRCVVSAGAGTVASADVTSVSVACTTNAYRVGGTVSGLMGSGLALRLNGGAPLPVSMNGSFTFPAMVSSGQTFLVEIATQPSSPMQTCTLGGETGTIATNDVTSVSVNCATDRRVIGGSVTGLVGTGLTLANGSDTLVVTANGAFSFPTTIAEGATYAVTVTQQPTGPHQTCVVGNGAGTAGTSNVTSVSVACTTNTYSVAVTVTGLTGTGFQLSLNGAAPQAITTATATLGMLASGATYAVSIAQQPTSPAQTCTLTGATGTVAGANVTVQVTCTTNTYRVGGTVSGLVGSGLSVRLNGGPSQAVSGSAFTLTPNVASGQPYAVTIAQQPTMPWQTCTVTNGSGTIADLDVSDVQLSCTTNSYTVGGIVTGLTGTGLELTMNGVRLSVGMPSFTFPALQSGTAWTVTVTGQPTSPSQTCAVTSGTGTLAGANVTSVAVACTTNSYSVGGPISGLTGAGLQLRLNTGAPQAVTGSSYTLTPPLPSGASYTVAIASQPPGQVCTLTNPTGTIGSADVSVPVVCLNAYSVGGTVTGLVGAGLTVSLSAGGSQSVSPASDGAFTFPNLVVAGTSWTASVTSAPANQQCTATGTSGTVLNANVTSIAVTCVNTWSIGGAVTGLTGTGLQLSVNGGPANSVSGPFSLTPRVLNGSTYSVGVIAQPVGQLCVVTNGTGTATGNVTNVGVLCAATPGSCNAWHLAYPALPSGAFPIRPAATTYDVYCDMVTSGGGWTLAMKIDGAAQTFNYDSSYWLDTATLNPSSTNLSDTQMKSQAYNEVAFTQLRVGLREGVDLRTATFTIAGASAQALVASAASFGDRPTWMSLSANAALQPNCNQSGASKNTGGSVSYYSGYGRVRLGHIADDGACGGHDSYIGLGGQAPNQCAGGVGVSAGNRGCFGAVNAMGMAVPDRNVPAWGSLWLR